MLGEDGQGSGGFRVIGKWSRGWFRWIPGGGADQGVIGRGQGFQVGVRREVTWGQGGLTVAVSLPPSILHALYL
jgi:hypothetical protein